MIPKIALILATSMALMSTHISAESPRQLLAATSQIFSLAPAGCSMAHCDQRLSDQTGVIGPKSAHLVHVDVYTGGSLGLGCASNTYIAACTYQQTKENLPRLIVFNAHGQRIWEDNDLLGPTAFMSAAIVGADNTIIAADQNYLLRVDPMSNLVLWKKHKNDNGIPISPVLVGSRLNMVLLATKSASLEFPLKSRAAEISVWDVNTGTLLSSKPLTDPSTGKLYVTRNTPAVKGNRVYIVTEADRDPTDGRFYALDICESKICGGRGKVSVAWHFDFSGTSGASPLLIGSRIFFDSRVGSNIGTFMAIEDTGVGPLLVWSREFSGYFYASAVQDPRGGLWVATAPAMLLIRLNQNNGNTDQTVEVGEVLGLGPNYAIGSVITASSSESGNVLLTFGAFVPSQDFMPTYLATVDVSNSASGSLQLIYQVADSFTTNAATGQFPVLIDPSGAKRLIFIGKSSSTFFVGEP